MEEKTRVRARDCNKHSQLRGGIDGFIYSSYYTYMLYTNYIRERDHLVHPQNGRRAVRAIHSRRTLCTSLY